MFLFTQLVSALSFIETDQDSPLNITEDNIGRYIVYQTGAKNQQRNNDVYFHCSIKIQNCTFFQCNAFETSMASGYGGIIYGEDCQLFAEKLVAKNCAALFGGAISMIESFMLIRDSEFSGNAAYRAAGAIFYRGDNNDCIVQIYNTSFNENAASDLAGAISIYGEGSTYFESVNFTGNHASIAGGAIDHVDNVMQFFECNFYGNYLDPALHTTEKEYSLIRGPSSKNNVRGGSSIFFISTLKDPLVVYMQGCCFGNNTVNQAYVDKSNSKVVNGYNLIFSGNFRWIAMLCGGIESYASTKYITQSDIDACTFQKQTYSPEKRECEFDVNNFVKEATITEYASTRSSTEISGTAVPSPTTYKYRATPLTQLPYATTKSFIHPEAISFHTNATLPTISFPATPMPSPSQSYSGYYISQTISRVETSIATQITSSAVESSSIVETTLEDGNVTQYITYWYTYAVIDTFIVAYTDAIINIELMPEDEKPAIDNTKLIIFIISGGAALLIVAIAIVTIIKCRRKDDVDEYSDELSPTGNSNVQNKPLIDDPKPIKKVSHSEKRRKEGADDLDFLQL